MKKIIFGLFAIIAVAFASCSREGPLEHLTENIPWAYNVIAFSDANYTQPVPGALVEIYRTQDDMDANTNVYLSGTTNDKGEALFTFADFSKNTLTTEQLKGVYYVRVTGNGTVAEIITNYLLFNSGTTTQWVVLAK